MRALRSSACFLAILLALPAVSAEAARGSKPKKPRPATQKYPKDPVPNNGEIVGVVSCYKPCANGEKNCNVTMEGKDAVAKQELCPGMKPISHAFQNASKNGGYYVVAASGKFRRQVGLGANVEIDGVPGTGIVCDVCPGCDKYGKILDLASIKSSDRNDCKSAPRGKVKIKIVSSKTAPGKR